MNSYINIIRESFAYFPVVALFFTIPYILTNYHKYGSVFSFRILIIYSFILYLMTVYFLVILPLPSYESVAAMTGARWQPVPFMFVLDILKEYQKTGALLRNKAILQYVFNVLMVVPFGMYLRYYFELDFKKTLKYSFLLSLFFELTQLTGLYFFYPRPYRLFDLDDLMANTLGGCLGYLLVKPLTTYLPSRTSLDQKSIHLSRKVSFLRRMSAFGLDILIVGFIMTVLAIFSETVRNSGPYFILTVIMGYYILIPVSFKGATLGMKYVHLRLYSTKGKYHFYQSIIRYLTCFAVIFALPIGLVRFASLLCDLVITEYHARIICKASSIVIYLFVLLVESILLFTSKNALCERLSATEIESTLKA